jgi:hypothetical protein
MLHDIPERFSLRRLIQKLLWWELGLVVLAFFSVLFAKQSHLKKLTDVVVMVKPSNLVIF